MNAFDGIKSILSVSESKTNTLYLVEAYKDPADTSEMLGMKVN